MINYVDFRYSKDKGKVQAGDVFNSALNMGPSDTFYTSDLVDGEMIGRIGSFATATDINLPWYPVIIPSVIVTMGAKQATVDGTGAIVADDGTWASGTLTVDGKLNLTVDGGATDFVYISYRVDNESVRSDGPEAAGFTNVPEFELKINTMPVEAKARTLRTYWAFDAQYELQKELTKIA
jgi:hypothetical protein